MSTYPSLRSVVCGVVAAYCVLCIIYQHANAVWACNRNGCHSTGNLHGNMHLFKYTCVFFGSVLMTYRDDPRRTHAATLLLVCGLAATVGLQFHSIVLWFTPTVTLLAQFCVFMYALLTLFVEY
jgi:hypothetical protein